MGPGKAANKHFEVFLSNFGAKYHFEKKIPKTTKMDPQINPNEATWLPKRARGCPEGLGEAGRERKTQQPQKVLHIFRKIVDLRRFGTPFGPQGGPIGIPKSILFDKICVLGPFISIKRCFAISHRFLDVLNHENTIKTNGFLMILGSTKRRKMNPKFLKLGP